MTSIAVRDGIMAYDSRFVDGTAISPLGLKKGWLSKRHPLFYACAGIYTTGLAISRALDRLTVLPWDDDTDITLPDDDGETTMFALHRDGRLFCFEGGSWYLNEGPFAAIGSGADSALGALHAGATAKQAVEISCLVDRNSGPPVCTVAAVDIPTPKQIKRPLRPRVTA